MPVTDSSHSVPALLPTATKPPDRGVRSRRDFLRHGKLPSPTLPPQYTDPHTSFSPSSQWCALKIFLAALKQATLSSVFTTPSRTIPVSYAYAHTRRGIANRTLSLLAGSLAPDTTCNMDDTRYVHREQQIEMVRKYKQQQKVELDMLNLLQASAGRLRRLSGATREHLAGPVRSGDWSRGPRNLFGVVLRRRKSLYSCTRV